MSQIVITIEKALKEALKAKDEVSLRALRLLKSDLQYEMTKSGARELQDGQVQEIIKRAVKKRRESIEQFKKAGRDDLVVGEEQELAILDRFLPEEVSAEAIAAIIQEAHDRLKPGGPGDMGKLMGAVMAKLKGQNVNGALVKEMVEKSLHA